MNQLVVQHAPEAFLSFIPPRGSSRFYLEYISRNFDIARDGGTTTA
jgi:hypothetical protein